MVRSWQVYCQLPLRCVLVVSFIGGSLRLVFESLPRLAVQNTEWSFRQAAPRSRRQIHLQHGHLALRDSFPCSDAFKPCLMFFYHVLLY